MGDFGVGRNPVALATASRAGGLESVARGRAGEVSEKRARRLGVPLGVLAVADEIIE